jgi:hypothetical protein
LEINDTVDNPGSPPGWMQAYEASTIYAKYNPVSGTSRNKDHKADLALATTLSKVPAKTQKSSIVPSTTDVIKLSNGNQRQGGLTLLNKSQLMMKVGVKTETVPRKGVSAIVVGH